MHNPEPVLENETHKILRYFQIEMIRQILAIRPDLVIDNEAKSEIAE